MKEYKDIDRLFQEKFRDFEIDPSAKVWKNIEKSLTTKPQKDRKAVWLWLSGVAASLVMFFFMNKPFFNTTTLEKKTETKQKISNKNNLDETKVVSTSPKETSPQTIKSHQFRTNSQNPQTAVATNPIKQIPTKTPQIQKKGIAISTEKENPQSSNKELPTNSKLQVVNTAILKNTTKPTQEVAQTDKSTQKLNTSQSKNETLQQENPSTNNDILAENTLKNDEQISNKKWTLSTVAAPVYLNAFDKKTSSIDNQFDDNVKQGNFSAAYGVQVAYQLSNRFSLQSGLHVVDYGYKTYGVYVSPSGAVSRYSNINYDSDANLVNVNAAPSTTQSNVLNEINIQETKGDLTQVFGYIEIPIEAKYRLNKGNLGINVVGGFSTLLLNKNEIFIETNDFSNKLGEASNLNSLNFSGNLGLELEYKIYKNVNFNLVPMFKVQTNTFEKNTGGFSPYVIGVYSGLNLRF